MGRKIGASLVIYVMQPVGAGQYNHTVAYLAKERPEARVTVRISSIASECEIISSRAVAQRPHHFLLLPKSARQDSRVSRLPI
jgi:hypothetical protein